ncbi:MAG: hypothetical protein IJZ53_10765 [Tyzzerella sp.]|nr:hypothetical protein [Tyzzerella sp.]
MSSKDNLTTEFVIDTKQADKAIDRMISKFDKLSVTIRKMSDTSIKQLAKGVQQVTANASQLTAEMNNLADVFAKVVSASQSVNLSSKTEVVEPKSNTGESILVPMENVAKNTKSYMDNIEGLSDVLANVKILLSGDLLEGDGFLAKLADVIALTVGGAGTLGESIMAIYGIGGVIAIAIGALITGLSLVFAKNEEVREGVSNALTSINEALQPVTEFLEKVFVSIWQNMIIPVLTCIGDTVLPKVMEVFGNLWNNVLVPLGEFLAGVFEPIVKVLSRAFEEIGDVIIKEVIPTVQSVIDTFTFLWSDVFVPIAEYLWDIFGPVVNDVFYGIADIIEGIKKIFVGLIRFVTGVFTGDWSKAWEGVKNIFSGIWEILIADLMTPINGILSLFEGLTNKIIDAFNFIKRSLNKLSFKIPLWVPDVGGESFGFKFSESKHISIPRFENGGIVEDGLFQASQGELIGRFSNGKTVVANNEMITAGIQEAAYRGFKQAIAEWKGVSNNTTIRVVGDPSGMFKVWKEEWNNEARRIQHNPVEIYT